MDPDQDALQVNEAIDAELGPDRVESVRMTRAYVLLAFGIVCIACSAIFVKVAALPGATSAFYRVAFAAAVAIPWWLGRRRTRRLAPRQLLLAGVSGAFFGIELLLWQMALTTTSAANATLLVNIAPVWVGIGALVFFRQRLGAWFWPGLGLSLVGMALVVVGGSHQRLAANGGDVLAIASSVFYALYLLGAQRTRAGMDTVTFLALTVAACLMVLLVAVILMHAPLSGFTLRAWVSLAALGLFSHLGGYLAIGFALGHLPASTVSVSLLAQPVITALLAVAFLGENLGLAQCIGGALVLGGILLVNRQRAI